MRHPWILPALRTGGLSAFLLSYYGLLYYSIFNFIGPRVANSPFGPTAIFMVLVVASGLPLLKYFLVDQHNQVRIYGWARLGLLVLYVLVGIPVSLGLVEYAGPFNALAILLGVALSLVYLVFSLIVSLPLHLYAIGVIRHRPGLVHTGAFLAIIFFPLTTFRLFLAGSQDFGNFILAWSILTGFLLAWDWGDISTKLSQAVAPIRRGVGTNPFATGLATYLPTGLVYILVSFLLVLVVQDLLIQRTILGGPTSYSHIFFWIGLLLLSILGLGYVIRFQDTPPAPEASE